MSTVVVGGGGPRPQARIVSMQEIPMQDGAEFGVRTYEIRDGDEVLGKFEKISHARLLLPLIQLGE